MTIRNWVLMSGLAVFGLLAAASATANEAYTLGAGDRVSITVYGQEDLATQSEVATDGTIAMPLLGRVEVEGLAPPAAAKLIAKRLELEGYLQTAHVNLLVDEYRSSMIAVLGQVNRPGRMAMQGPTSIPDVLAMVGGISQDGGERIILIRTNSEGKQTRQEFNLDQLLDSQAQDRSQINLRKGDTLYVPRADQFYVHGQVKQPGTYPLDRQLNIMQALSISGGFNPSASTDGLILYRKQPDGSVIKREVELTDQIEDGDVLFVKESLF